MGKRRMTLGAILGLLLAASPAAAQHGHGEHGSQPPARHTAMGDSAMVVLHADSLADLLGLAAEARPEFAVRLERLAGTMRQAHALHARAEHDGERDEATMREAHAAFEQAVAAVDELLTEEQRVLFREVLHQHERGEHPDHGDGDHDRRRGHDRDRGGRHSGGSA